MIEYYTKALVLDKESRSEYGATVHLFTRDIGRVEAKGAGLKRITSKLSGHLDPGLISFVRLVEKNGFVLADALRVHRFRFSFDSLNTIKHLAPELMRDDDLWGSILNREVKPEDLLSHFGYDTKFARCSLCGRSPVSCFSFASHSFLCDSCLIASQLSEGEVVCI